MLCVQRKRKVSITRRLRGFAPDCTYARTFQFSATGLAKDHKLLRSYSIVFPVTRSNIKARRCGLLVDIDWSRRDG